MAVETQQGRSKIGLAKRAEDNNNAGDIVESLVSGNLYDSTPTDTNEEAYNVIADRVASGSMNIPLETGTARQNADIASLNSGQTVFSEKQMLDKAAEEGSDRQTPYPVFDKYDVTEVLEDDF